ncbi:hypothetical protein [Nesterenkonia salmonea]|nr:hypothetical protein [Nesterenkonia salmonea]
MSEFLSITGQLPLVLFGALVLTLAVLGSVVAYDARRDQGEQLTHR